MKRKIVCIESPDFMILPLNRIAKEKGDEVFLLTSDKTRLKDDHTFYVDVREDLEKVCEIIKTQIGTPDAIITSQEMFLTQTASIANEFGLLKDSLADIEQYRDKACMKEIWIKKDVQTPTGKFYKSFKEIEKEIHNLNYPVIIKPSSGYASCGVKKISSSSEMKEQVRKIFLINSTVVAKENLKSSGILVEDYIDGEEYSIDTIWYNGEPICSGILSKGNAKGPYFPDRLYMYDSLLDSKIKEKIENLSYKAVRALGLKFGSTHTEIRFKGDEPYVIETTSRPGAGGVFFDLFQMAKGINFYEVYYAALISNDVNYLDFVRTLDEPSNKTANYFWYNIPHKGDGIIKQINGIEEIKARKEILSLICYKKEGSSLYKDDLNTDYFCSVVGVLNNDSEKTINQLMGEYDSLLEVVYR
ncbi:ATP-grasp domain-containing protein [Bacillus toyonensis]|uniref:ATP-grasp domain-containing protein n=1 Tax=Bacillus toyonensis TaxID=155322 RepID=UPI0021760E83|nr:ATP-grasp domain-containing protein [Bacillus toyonensis]